MKRLFIFILCFAVLVTPCFAVEVEESLEATQATEAVTTVIAENTTEFITEKTEPVQETQVTEQHSVEKEEVKIPEKQEEPESVDNSQPRLMVVSYEIEDGFISPQETKKLTVTLKNMHASKAVSNIKLSISEDADEIRVTGMGTKYVS